MSSIDIANQALTRLGADRITSFNDETTEAYVMSEIYDGCKRTLLRTHPWNFAMARARLAQLAEEPLMEFPFQYALPDDFIRLVEVWFGDDAFRKNRVAERRQWQLEGSRLLTTQENITVRYVKNTDAFDPHFEQALVGLLAYEAAYTLPASNTAQQAFYQMYQNKLGEAKQVDMLENQFNVKPPIQLDAVRY